MNSYFFIYKSIGITWFLFLTIISIIISYYITIFIGKDRGLKKNEVEDIFFILVISGFIGARLGYVVFNLDLYKGHLKYIFSINHINLSLLGGVIAGLITLIFISKKYKFSFYYLFKIFLIPFYFSMSLAMWSLFFEGRLIGREYSGFLSMYHLSAYRHPVVLYLSLIFIVGLVIEAINITKSSILNKLRKILLKSNTEIILKIFTIIRDNNFLWIIKRGILGKYISYLAFVLILISYYLIRIKLAV